MQTRIGENAYMLIGNATRNAEFKTVGEKNTPLAKFSLAIGKDAEGNAMYADCQAWARMANHAKGILKGETVLVIGSLDTKTGTNGKEYKNINVEWVGVLGSTSTQAIVPPVQQSEGQQDSGENHYPFSGDDEDLPF
jgi:single-stranded DNA-binding protein